MKLKITETLTAKVEQIKILKFYISVKVDQNRLKLFHLLVLPFSMVCEIFKLFETLKNVEFFGLGL